MTLTDCQLHATASDAVNLTTFAAPSVHIKKKMKGIMIKFNCIGLLTQVHQDFTSFVFMRNNRTGITWHSIFYP